MDVGHVSETPLRAKNLRKETALEDDMKDGMGVGVGGFLPRCGPGALGGSSGILVTVVEIAPTVTGTKASCTPFSWLLSLWVVDFVYTISKVPTAQRWVDPCVCGCFCI